MEWWLGVAVVLVSAGVMLGTLTLVRARLPPEISRKAAHVGTGLLALTFPFLFDPPWPVVGLLAAVSAGLFGVKRIGALRGSVGRVLHDVDRQSFGEFYLLASIAVLFVVAGGTVLYAIPVLIVTFADATAAIVGGAYGRNRYDATEGQKSTEGSIAFFVVAFFATHVPLLLFTDTGRGDSLLLGLILGFLLVLFEGIAWKGLDNLFIPLSAYLLLRALLPQQGAALILVVVVAAAMGLFALLWRRHTTLNASALFGAVLVGFLFWAIGGWPWLVPPVSLFVAYTLLPPRIDLDRMRIHNVHVVLSVTGAGIAWLFLGRLVDAAAAFYLPFAAAFAAHLAIILAVRLRYARAAIRDAPLLAASVGQAALLILGPYWFLTRDTLGAALALAATSLATAAFLAWHLRGRGIPDPELRWRRESVCATLASAALVLPILMVA